MKLKYLLLIFIILIIGAGAAYWYYFWKGTPEVSISSPSADQTGPNGFVPFNRDRGNSPNGLTPSNPTATSSKTTSTTETVISLPPKLRLLSNLPVGGFGANTTAQIGVVRWVDRGRGNVYEARSTSTDIYTISNTVFPRIYESWWNANLTGFVAQYIESDSESITTISAAIQKRNSSLSTTSANFTEYELRGNTWNKKPVTLATSPKRDRIFYIAVENNLGVGYISPIDGRTPTKLFSSPLTQIVADWPEENTIMITTNASASHNGYVYIVNAKTGAWKKIIGPLPGLTAKISRDGRFAFISATGNAGDIVTSIYDIKNGKGIDATIRTLAEKCVWGNFYKELIYCAAASQLPASTYPDDWYKGTVSFTDKVWQINGTTGEVKLISSIVDQSDRLIDAYRLEIDKNDNYLYFMNKNDLSLWSLDLVAQ